MSNREGLPQAQYVTEIDVLIGVAKWLHSNGWTLEKISMPHGRGIDPVGNKDKLEAEFKSAGISTNNIRFTPAGEDIRARKGDNIWRVECKCLSGGKPTTDKTNFDRAVASTVSYYTQSDRLRLGLALPDSEEYKKFLRDKLPRTLREAIELWVFLYCSKDEVYEFAPDEEIP